MSGMTRIKQNRIFQRFALMNFRSRLLLYFFVLALLVLLLAGLLLSFFITRIVTDSEQARLSQFVQIVNEDLGSRIEGYNAVVMDLMLNSELRSNLGHSDAADRAVAGKYIYNLLKMKSLSTRGLQNLAVIDFEGNAWSSWFALRLPEGFELAESGVYRQLFDNGRTLVWLSNDDTYRMYGTNDMYRSTSDIHVAGIIKNYSRNEEFGIVILTLNGRYFNDITYSGELIEGTNLYLISPDKTAIHTVSGTTEPLPDETLAILNFKTEAHGTKVIGRSVVSFQYNDAMDWYLVSSTNIRDLRHKLPGMLMVLTAAMGLALLVAVAFSRMMVRHLTEGIDEIMETMIQVEQGDFDVQVPTERLDEFGRLAGAFNHMVRQVKQLIYSRYQQQMLAREAEFRALQAQINPHFLYNTLDMLHWKLAENGHEELSLDIVAIGSLLRYAIDYEQRTASLSQELENIEHYLHVQSSVSKKKFETAFSLDDAQDVRLPRLTLQPIIENALIHGFQRRRNNNRLEIVGCIDEDGCYRIEISDNGIGIPPDTLTQLNSDESRDDSTHIGLHSVRARLQYLYGDAAELRVESRYGDGVRVCIRIPIQKEPLYENNHY